VDGAVGYTLDIPLNSMNPVKAEWKYIFIQCSLLNKRAFILVMFPGFSSLNVW
jgi:hypothetical protein